jgi:multiple sugar transport system permease protein
LGGEKKQSNKEVARMFNGKGSWWKILLQCPFYVLALTMLLPYYWMIISVFKPVSELIQNPPDFFIRKPTLTNFYDPLATLRHTEFGHVLGLFQYFPETKLRFGMFFVNSVLISCTITVLALLIASAVAFVLAKHRIPGRDIIFYTIVASMMIPWQVTLIPNFLTVKSLGWMDTYQGYVIPAMAKAFAVFFMRQYMLSLPDELLDAARIDGASEIRIWWRIILPLIRPAIAAMAIFTVLSEWNNFVWPLIIVKSDAMATMPLAIARINADFAQNPQHMGVSMAAALLASLPTLIFFLAFQRHFIKGIAMTGLKE